MESPGLIPDNAEEATTSLILTADELDAILIAINDSSVKCQIILEQAESDENEDIEEIADQLNISVDKAIELHDKTVALADHLLETYGPIIEQIREVLPEVQETDKLRKPPFIIK